MVITQEMMDCLHPPDEWKTLEDLYGHKFKCQCKVCGLIFEYNQKTNKRTLYEDPASYGLKFRGFAKE